jgi:hypothetical protein
MTHTTLMKNAQPQEFRIYKDESELKKSEKVLKDVKNFIQ